MPLLETVIFYLFALGAITSSALVVGLRNPLYSAIALIADFFFFAGLYVLLSAHFMAVVQVLVYGGAIMVLFVFIIMLLNLREEDLGVSRFRVHHILAVVVGLGFLYFSLLAFGPLFDRDEVKANRAAAAERIESGEEDVQIQTFTRVPTLYADLNEPALEYQYQRQLEGLRAGTTNPAQNKYRTFEPDKKFEVPPALLNKDPRGGDLQEKVRWGTVEPISILMVNRFVVPFELTALLLLAAIVGAVIIAKKRL